MRTTLNIEDEIYEAARVLARTRGASLGAIISELARRGLEAPLREHPLDAGLPTFDVREGAALIPGDRASELLADEGLEG